MLGSSIGRSSIGLDFGTTNSAVAVFDGTSTRIASFPFMETVVDTFRSILFFQEAPGRTLAGPKAVEAYLEPHEAGRLVQSLKSFLSSTTFTRTLINGRYYTLEELIGIFLRVLRSEAEEQLGPLEGPLVAGRPVRFVGAKTNEQEELALTRLRAAYAIAGWNEVTFAYEPVGAAYAYAQRLHGPELVLIADFGGGTSDFSLVNLAPEAQASIIGSTGVGVGGDSFDARLVRHLVSPILGFGSTYQSLGKTLPVPASLYRKLESWHQLSFLRTRDNLRTIESLRAQAEDPLKLERLLEIVQDDLGYHLHRAVQRTKVDLSLHEEAQFLFTDSSTKISTPVTRQEFEGYIAPELEAMSGAVAELFAETGTDPNQVDRVFLTGGSSLVPAVRNLFKQKFGADKLAGGDEFTSVAKGLAAQAWEAS